MAHRPWFRRPGRVIPLGLLASGLIFTIVAVASPWPTALAIRALFEQSAVNTVAEMSKYVPEQGIDEIRDVAYADQGANTTFDAFSPSGSTGPLPTVV